MTLLFAARRPPQEKGRLQDLNATIAPNNPDYAPPSHILDYGRQRRQTPRKRATADWRR